MVIRAAKRTQHCTFCKNHGLSEPKKGHQCPFANCPCLLCKLTKKAQVAMRHQQRVWRHKKQALKTQAGDDESPAGDRPSKGQACDKCRNHNIIKPKRNHDCPYQECSCEYCSLTFKRRVIMKHQQRIRRSKIMSQVETDGKGSTDDGNGMNEEEDEPSGIDIDNDSKDSTPEQFCGDVFPNSTDREVGRSSEASPMTGVSQAKELDSLSARFSSLEADCPISPESDSKETGKEYISDLGASAHQMSISSPPPLLPLESDNPLSPEYITYKTHSILPSNRYEISPCDRDSFEGEPYRNTRSYSQGYRMVESSHLSAFMLLQRERYLSDPSGTFYSTPRQAQQQSSSTLKMTMDQSFINRDVHNHSYPNENKYNHSRDVAPLSDFTHSASMLLQQREYESQHQQVHQQQLHRHQQFRQPYPLYQAQRNHEQPYKFPYYHQTQLNS